MKGNALTTPTAIFVGPTLHGWDRGTVPPDWHVHPPAALGDLTAAADAGARRIVLIDGRFISRLPPSPAEILELLRRGLDVWGAASLGALRAVELERCGMRGDGWVFQQFRSRRLLADDEMMVVYEEGSGRSLSEALVTVRYALARLRAVLPPGAATCVRKEMQALYFPERTRQALMRCLMRHAGPRRARLFMDQYDACDIKKRDATSLLERLKREGK